MTLRRLSLEICGTHLSVCHPVVEISPPGGRRETHEAQEVKETNKDQEVSQTYKIQQALP